MSSGTHKKIRTFHLWFEATGPIQSVWVWFWYPRLDSNEASEARNL